MSPDLQRCLKQMFQGGLALTQSGELAKEHMANTQAAEQARSARRKAQNRRQTQNGGVIYASEAREKAKATSAKINLVSEAAIMHLDVRTIDYCVHSVWSVWSWVARLKCVRSVVAILGYLPYFLTHITTPSLLRIYHSSTLLPQYLLETTRLIYIFPALERG